MQADGYAIIPEVQKYYKNLDITQELLDKVHTLHYGYVNCNGLGTYANMLPNLKKIKGDDFDDLFDGAFLEALKKCNIVLEDTGY